MTILLTFHSHEGQTAKIADRIAARLRASGIDVDVRAVDAAPAPDRYDAVVFGDSIRFERHSRALRRYLGKHRDVLVNRPTAMFQVSMTSAGTDADHVAKAAEMADKLVRQAQVQPDLVELFAGAIAYSKYGWVTKRVMRSIARREGNGTDMSRDHEYTDWAAVDRFAEQIAALVRGRALELPATRDA